MVWAISEPVGDPVELGAAIPWALAVIAPQHAPNATDIANAESSLRIDIFMVFSDSPFGGMPLILGYPSAEGEVTMCGVRRDLGVGANQCHAQSSDLT